MKSIPSIYNDHLLVILNNIYSTTAHVILTDTSTLPLRFSSLRKSLDMHNSVRIRSLAIDLHIGSYHGATSSSFCQVLQESRGKFNTLSNAFFFFYSRHQLRPIAIYWRSCPSPGSETKFVVSGFHARKNYGDKQLLLSNACRTVRLRIPVQRFHARSSYSHQHHFYAVRGERRTTVSTLWHTKWVTWTAHWHCAHIEHQKPLYVLLISHAKLVLDLFHAFTQDVPYRRPRDISRTIQNEDWVVGTRPHLTITTRRPKRAGTWIQVVDKSADLVGGNRLESVNTTERRIRGVTGSQLVWKYDAEPGTEKSYLADLIHEASTSNIITRWWVTRRPAWSFSFTSIVAATTAPSRSRYTMVIGTSSSSSKTAAALHE